MDTSIKKRILISIPLLFVLGSILHFTYDFSGKNTIVGLFSATNESIFEHTKLAFIPITLWWLINYLKTKNKINAKAWFTAGFSSALTSTIAIPFIFYFYTNTFGIESIIIDILILLFCIAIGQLLSIHLYTYSKGMSTKLIICLWLIVIVFFVVFTIYPPSLPIFIDPTVLLNII